MVDHILNEHEEYSMPRHRLPGVALPVVVCMGVNKLTDIEQTAARIPKERWQVGRGGDKENVPASASRTQKCPTLKLATSLPSKQPHITIQPLQIALTSVA
ncbi:hypothetical protein EDB19DRAFT_1827496 [Suillus lakei]|nr:hypothetical protein EDB19DRAFT_1827496 [Suillus lakei]